MQSRLIYLPTFSLIAVCVYFIYKGNNKFFTFYRHFISIF